MRNPKFFAYSTAIPSVAVHSTWLPLCEDASSDCNVCSQICRHGGLARIWHRIESRCTVSTPKRTRPDLNGRERGIANLPVLHKERGET